MPASNQQRIKVAYLLGKLDRGGAETLVLDVFNNTDIAQFDLIAVYRKKGNLYNGFQQTIVPLIQINFKTKFDVLYPFRLKRYLSSQKIDIVHSHQLFDALLGWCANLFSSRKLVHTFHGHSLYTNKVHKLLLRFIVKQTDSNIFVSQQQKKYYTGKFQLLPHKQKVVYNGLSQKKFNINAGNNIRNELNIDKTKVLLGWVGNFNPGRNPLFICKFLDALKTKHNLTPVFLFIGERTESTPWIFDQCHEFCTEHKLENVLFLGLRNDVPSILQQLDAYIYSSEHDTFGIAVIEAIASGTPVFVNDWEVMLEITKNGKYANIYETNNILDLTQKFLDYLNHGIKYQSVAQENAIQIKKLYGIEKHIAQLNNLYTELIS